MPKATNALHSDQISTAQAGIAKSVVGRDARAQERRGLCGCELVRNGSEAARFSDHHFRISTIHGYPRDHGVPTIHDVSAPAWFAHAVLATEEADTDPLTDFPSGYSAAQSIDATDNLMSRNARQSQTRVGARDRGRIGVTDSACFHPNANLSCRGRGERPLDDLQRARFGHFHRRVGARHGRPPRNSDTCFTPALSTHSVGAISR